MGKTNHYSPIMPDFPAAKPPLNRLPSLESVPSDDTRSSSLERVASDNTTIPEKPINRLLTLESVVFNNMSAKPLLLKQSSCATLTDPKPISVGLRKHSNTKRRQKRPASVLRVTGTTVFTVSL